MDEKRIAAVVLAAGLSRRMGFPKMVLPWGDTTVIGQVVNVLSQAGLGEILVVTGGAHSQVEAALKGSLARTVFNPRYQEDQMTLSLQLGLAGLSGGVQAALVVLGDQPQIKGEIVAAISSAYFTTGAPLVVPSFQMRRGHPWLVDRSLWGEIMAIQPPQTLRDLMNAQQDHIHYLNALDDSILRDLDTPDDYDREHPGPAR
jgi:molybdenum cofactor cytidylyltransferase